MSVYYQLLVKNMTGWTVRGNHESNAAGAISRLKSLLITERPVAHLLAAPDLVDLQRSVQAYVTGGTISGVELPIDISEEDLKRFEMEYGPGGDHNAPYFFQLPFEGKVQRKWTKLFARVLRGDIGGKDDGAVRTGSVAEPGA